MTDDKSKPAKPPEPGAPKQSGRVAYDAKGNPIWEWETSTGVYDRNVSTQRLKKLEAKLSLEETQPVLKHKGLELQDAERMPGGGMNPYDTGAGSDRTPSAVTHPALAHKQAKKEPISNSLASKYAAAAKRKQQAPPQSFLQKLLMRFKGK